ncbi:MAG: tetratricopeptide repeat protein [Bacteroidales bacterium]|nr:tetratricopeptide repeat protein [Bacteroidales bacterium]
MKHITAIAALLLALSANLFAGTNEELFNQANELYKSGNYPQSIELYNQILDAGYESATLYYNLGNAEFRNGSLGRAILNYERAYRLAPNDNDIFNNLEFARSKTTDNINEMPSFFLSEWASGLVGLFSLNGWAVACIVLMLIVCAVWAFFFIAKSYGAKKTSFFAGLALTAVLVAAFISLCASNSRANSHNEAIIMLPAVSVKTSPDADAADKFLLHEGTKVEVEDAINEWTKIKLSDGNTGWTENSNLETI